MAFIWSESMNVNKLYDDIVGGITRTYDLISIDTAMLGGYTTDLPTMNPGANESVGFPFDSADVVAIIVPRSGGNVRGFLELAYKFPGIGTEDVLRCQCNGKDPIILFNDATRSLVRVFNGTTKPLAVSIIFGIGLTTAYPDIPTSGGGGGGGPTADEIAEAIINKAIDNLNFNLTNGGKVSDSAKPPFGPLKGF